MSDADTDSSSCHHSPVQHFCLLRAIHHSCAGGLGPGLLQGSMLEGGRLHGWHQGWRGQPRRRASRNITACVEQLPWAVGGGRGRTLHVSQRASFTRSHAKMAASSLYSRPLMLLRRSTSVLRQAPPAVVPRPFEMLFEFFIGGSPQKNRRRNPPNCFPVPKIVVARGTGR